ncbi:MAG: DUF3109 family protein [Muribaculaceae bacterium]|nr:DUF3109 family protein [Muribaculaceae bacterium]MDE6793306.1 DUF3109 family protein [Muribaculaceae bacterium]
MLLIKDTLVSLDLIERFFVCNLDKCLGQCCVDGDAGAPLLPEEKREIDRHLDAILPLLNPKAREVVKEEGSSYIDEEGDLVTQIVEGKDCVFTTYAEGGKCLCALEKAYREGRLPQLKPSSCHLYPVRLKQVGDFTALNFHRWKICKPAETLGRAQGVRAYIFLKEPLIRKFGEEWYEELCRTAEEWIKNNSSQDRRN